MYYHKAAIFILLMGYSLFAGLTINGVPDSPVEIGTYTLTIIADDSQPYDFSVQLDSDAYDAGAVDLNNPVEGEANGDLWNATDYRNVAAAWTFSSNDATTGVMPNLAAGVRASIDLVVQGNNVNSFEIRLLDQNLNVLNTYNLTIYQPPVTLSTTIIGTGSVSPSSGDYDSGTEVTLTATPGVGYQVAGWAGVDPGSISQDKLTATVTMSADKSVTVTFEPITYDLTASVSTGQGTISPTSGTYNMNTVVTLTAAPASGWRVLSWSGVDTGSVSVDKTTAAVTISADKTVSVAFEEIPTVTYTLTSQVVGQHGTLTTDPAGGTYPDGTTVALTAVPEQGYEVKQWVGVDDGSISDDKLTAQVTMAADKAVSVEFQPITHTLTTSVDSQTGALTINPAGGVYDYNTQVTLTAAPAAGYELDTWTGLQEGELSDDGLTATLAMTSDRTVSVTFKLITYQLTAAVAQGQGAVSPTQGTYYQDEDVILTAAPADGYRVKAWTGVDLVSNDKLTASVKMTSDISVTVAFEEIPSAVADIDQFKVKDKDPGSDKIIIKGTISPLDGGLAAALIGNPVQVIVSPAEDGTVTFAAEEGKNGRYKFKDDDNNSLKLDAESGDFIFSAKSLDLTGLTADAARLDIIIGDYWAAGDASALADVPLELLRGSQDALTIDKNPVIAKVDDGIVGKMIIQGSFIIAGKSGSVGANYLNANPVNITWGNGQTVTIPANSTGSQIKNDIFKYKRPKELTGGVKMALFKVDKLQYRIMLEDVAIPADDLTGIEELRIQVGSFDQTAYYDLGE